MAKNTIKKNISSLHVLKTLKLLLEDNYTMAELIQKLNEQEKESIFNNSVISKYINTCRFCGVKIVKIFNKYYVTKLPFGLNLTDDETNLIQNLKNAVIAELSTKSCNKFQKFIDKLNRYTNKKIARVEKKAYPIAFELFEKAINMKKRVKLLFKNRYELSGIPVDITTQKGKIFFRIYTKSRIRMIDASRLSGIEVLDETFVGYMNEQDVLFKLKGKLAKRYEIREEEELRNIVPPEDGILVCNKSRNSEMLLSRLMRYDSLCEVVAPKIIREDMKELINDTLLNYGIK